MFGIIYALATGIFGIGGSIKATHEEVQQIKNGKEKRAKGQNPNNIYVDRNGATRSLDTGCVVNGERDAVTGDLWEKSAPNVFSYQTERTVNRSEAWREDNFNKVKEQRPEGKTVVNDIFVDRAAYLKTDNTDYHARGQWFKDLDTSDKYIARYIMGTEVGMRDIFYKAAFYMNIKTGELVRFTDRQRLVTEENHLDYINPDYEVKVIEAYNRKLPEMKRQYKEKYKTVPSKYWDWLYHNSKIATDKDELEEHVAMKNARC